MGQTTRSAGLKSDGELVQGDLGDHFAFTGATHMAPKGQNEDWALMMGASGDAEWAALKDTKPEAASGEPVYDGAVLDFTLTGDGDF